MLTSLLVNTQHCHNLVINIVSPILKKSIKQVRIEYVDDTNLWARLEDNDDLLFATQKGQEGVDI